jgi:thiol-disulfide isomerase/thioredoxin
VPYVAAALLLLGALCLFNLVLIFGVIRRLREHTEALSGLSLVGGPSEVILPAGSAVGPFVAVTVDGAAVSRDDLDGETLVGFFAPGCRNCEAQLPQFVELATRHPGGPHRVLAVVVGAPEPDAAASTGGAGSPTVAALARVARVVLARPDAEVTKAFGVQGFPAYAVVGPAGVLVTSGPRPGVLDAHTVVA